MKRYQMMAVFSLASMAMIVSASDISDSYSTGDTLTADHLNNIKSAVNDNDTRISDNAGAIEENANAISNLGSKTGYVLKDAGGVVIGKLVGMYGMHLPYVLTEQGYLTLIHRRVAMVFWTDLDYGDEYLKYQSLDCSGNAYVRPGVLRGTVYHAPLAGWYEEAYDAGLLFYTPYDEVQVPVSVNSVLKPDYTSGLFECESLPSPSSEDLYRAYPNDYSVTGIHNTVYAGPLVIE